jgi:hypothetical protein
MGNYRKRTPEREALARQMVEAAQAAGLPPNWNAIGEAIGLEPRTARAWFDPAFRLRRMKFRTEKKDVYFRQLGGFHMERPETKRDALERMREIPPDTRTEIQRLLGEPPPGRSALDQKRAQQ